MELRAASAFSCGSVLRGDGGVEVACRCGEASAYGVLLCLCAEVLQFRWQIVAPTGIDRRNCRAEQESPDLVMCWMAVFKSAFQHGLAARWLAGHERFTVPQEFRQAHQLAGVGCACHSFQRLR